MNAQHPTVAPLQRPADVHPVVADRNRFLAGTLSDSEEAAFVAHLDACPACRDALERAAGDAGGWEDARLLATPSRPVGTDAATGLPADLAFLAPTDDPRELGRIGGYGVTGLIGRGGMGAVFRALDPPLGRTVAVKVIDPALAADPATRARFAREARAMAAVSHPHVVPVYAVDEHRVPAPSGQHRDPPRTLPYFVMEYVPGETLAGRLARTGPLPVLAAVRVARQVALGLAAAHEQGLIHRDVKPANILLERGVERVRVADFGLARPTEADDRTSLTHTGQTAGTPEYMAPEQVRGEPCDGRADLFALGAVLHAMLVGHGPFRGPTLYEVLRRVVEHDVPPATASNPAVPPWLAAFVTKLLAKAPADRFGSAAEVADRLAAELAHLEHPRTAPPVRDYLPAAGWFTRRRRFAAAAVVAFAGTGLLTHLIGERPADAPFLPPRPAAAAPPATPPPTAVPDVGVPDVELPDAAALDADLRAAARAADAVAAENFADPPPAADAWRTELDAADRQADRLLRGLAEEFP